MEPVYNDAGDMGPIVQPRVWFTNFNMLVYWLIFNAFRGIRCRHCSVRPQRARTDLPARGLQVVYVGT